MLGDLWAILWTARSRLLLWLLVSLTALSFVMLKDVSNLLHSVQGPSGSYNSSVYTAPRNPIHIDQLRGAIDLWACADGVAGKECPPKTAALTPFAPVRTVLRWHLLLDLLVFTPGYCVLLALALRAVGVPTSFWRSVTLFLFAADTLETLFTLIVFWDLRAADSSLYLIQALSFLKWLSVLVAVVPLAVWSFKNADGKFNVHRVLFELKVARGGGNQHPAIALWSLATLVVAFGAIIALPVGGPLDQFPDVLRYQLGHGDRGLMFCSTLALLSLAVAIAIAGLMATDPGTSAPSLSALPDRLAASVAVLLAGGIFVLTLLFGGASWSLALFAPSAFLIVPLALMLLRWLLSVAGIPWTTEPVLFQPGEERAPLERLWVGGLAGTILMIGGLGLVRAAFAPMITGIPNEAISWKLVALFGAGATIFGGLSGQSLVLMVEAWRTTSRRRISSRVLAALLAAAICLTVIIFARDPSRASVVGTTGVAAISLAFFALAIGLMSWISRLVPPWDVTRQLGLGVRTPMVGLLVVIWFVAGAFHMGDGYNDVRIPDGPEHPPTYSRSRYTSIQDAFAEWEKVQLRPELALCPRASDGSVPLILVAAPGGGIKAAYWTNKALEALFGPDAGACAARLFAISGVSGGSVGATTWVAAKGAGKPPTAAVIEGMADDDALSAAIAGLLLRDLPQPLTGFSRRWDDRAGLLEDAWIESAAGSLGTIDHPLEWKDVGSGGGLLFPPVLVLNGSSVSDGCRVLITNTAQLAAGTGADCYFVPAPGAAPLGPVSGSIDPLKGCLSKEDSTTSLERRDGLSAAAAALLTARFPAISTSGLLSHCVPGTSDTSTTAIVDGGYYENSALLTLVQMWSAIEPMARDGCRPGSGKLCVVPWVVELDSHYRAEVEISVPSEPLELFAPLIALFKDELLSQRGLEQMAAWSGTLGHTSCAEPAALTNSVPAGDAPAMLCPGYTRVGLSSRPSVAAPLGWVLSKASRQNLTDQLVGSFKCPKVDLSLLLNSLQPKRRDVSSSGECP